MRLGTIILTNVSRLIRNGKVPIMIAAIGAVSILSVAGEFAGNGEVVGTVNYYHSYLYNYDIWFVPLLYTMAAYTAIQNICQEWKNNYWKPNEQRCGKKTYLNGNCISCYLVGFGTMFFGQGVYLLILLLLGSCWGLPLMNESYDSWCGMVTHPFCYWLLKTVLFSSSAGFWSMVSFFMAVIQMDRFIAVTVPLALNILLNFILHRLTNGAISLNAISQMAGIMREDAIDPVGSFVMGMLIFGILSVLTGSVSAKVLRKRIENEWYA